MFLLVENHWRWEFAVINFLHDKCNNDRLYLSFPPTQVCRMLSMLIGKQAG